MATKRDGTTVPGESASLGFLLSQIGAHVSSRFAAKLEPLGLKPAHVGILRVIRVSDGLSQQALGERLGVFPSRLVGLIDELEKLKLMERRNSPVDRRSYSLHLTGAGLSALGEVDRVSREEQEQVSTALAPAEQAQLVKLLERIAVEQGLRPGVHPGFRRPDPDGC